MFISASVDYSVDYNRHMQDYTYSTQCEDGYAGDISSLMSNVLLNFKIGDATYTFFPHISGYYSFSFITEENKKSYLFIVPEFDKFFRGSGRTLFSAKNNWMEKFHCFFQTIYYNREFDISGDEKEFLDVVKKTMDIQKYRNSLPLETTSIGRITKKSARIPKRIEWIDGKTDTCPGLSDVPQEFASYRFNEYFKATILRNPVTNEIIRILTCSRSNYRICDSKEIEDFINLLPGTNSFPDASFVE